MISKLGFLFCKRIILQEAFPDHFNKQEMDTLQGFPTTFRDDFDGMFKCFLINHYYYYYYYHNHYYYYYFTDQRNHYQ